MQELVVTIISSLGYSVTDEPEAVDDSATVRATLLFNFGLIILSIAFRRFDWYLALNYSKLVN